MINKPVSIVLLMLVYCLSVGGQSWKTLSPYFKPPKEYKNKYGDYRSPLLFYDGNKVKSKADWQYRRTEILERWHLMMGKWPDLMKDQEFEVIETTDREDITQMKVRFMLTPVEESEGYLLLPPGKSKRPAVITVYYEPWTAIGEGAEERDFAIQLARKGFVTLSIGTTKTTASKTFSTYYPDISNATVQPLSMLAYAAANAWYALAKLDVVDSARIGIAGHSYGGKWAMFASCLFDKFACAAWSDPGIVFDDTRPNVNYWEPWYLGYYPPPWENTWRKEGMTKGAKGLYPVLRTNGYDLHELHSLMAPRPFLVSGGSEDTPARWIPLNHTIRVNELLGYKNRVGMTNRPDHPPTKESNKVMYEFFEYFLK